MPTARHICQTRPPPHIHKPLTPRSRPAHKPRAGWGIDIEEARQEQLSRIAARVLDEDEISAYSHDLVQAWTLKEAAFKAAGLPIADLREIHLGANGTITARGLRLSIVESRTVEAGAYRCRLSVVKASSLITP